jgi:hypothetical protein
MSRRAALFVVLLAGCARYQVELLDAPAADARLPRCQGHVCACTNGLDDDGDGLADGLDDACIGALDDDEAALGMGDDRGRACLDCFFDANDGSDEGCRYPETCRTSGTSTDGCGECTASTECVGGCRPLVPNGCDCFGCCGVETASGPRAVVLVDGCTLEAIEDPSACPPCIPSPSCANECERCELCPGRASLPDDCAPSCGDGETPCSTSTDCGADQACVLGCCIGMPR